MIEVGGIDEAASIAALILRLRRRRAEALPRALFGETAWELLLDLFVADAEGRRMTGREFAAHTGNAPATTSRWLRFLSDEGLVVGDGTGELDDYLTLAPTALTAIENYMADLGIVIRTALAENQAGDPS